MRAVWGEITGFPLGSTSWFARREKNRCWFSKFGDWCGKHNIEAKQRQQELSKCHNHPQFWQMIGMTYWTEPIRNWRLHPQLDRWLKIQSDAPTAIHKVFTPLSWFVNAAFSSLTWYLQWSKVVHFFNQHNQLTDPCPLSGLWNWHVGYANHLVRSPNQAVHGTCEWHAASSCYMRILADVCLYWSWNHLESHPKSPQIWLIGFQQFLGRSSWAAIHIHSHGAIRFRSLLASANASRFRGIAWKFRVVNCDEDYH